MRYFNILLLSLVVFASCTKTEEKLITGNEPPPDQTLPQGLRSSFVTKAYIGLLGREADQTEFDAAMSELNSDNFSKSSRRSVITSVLESDDFYTREFELGRINLLNGLDTLQVRDFINTFEYLLTLPAYEAQWPVIETELAKLYDLQSCVEDLRSGAIEFREMNRRCIDNNFYDQINMGSLNFVLACFQNLLLRNPTEYELEQGIRMVDGFNGVIFLEAGSSKREFEDLFIASRDYAEGQVKILFNRFLFRVPDSEEMTALAEEYQQNNNYKTLITKILETDEYAGL